MKNLIRQRKGKSIISVFSFTQGIFLSFFLSFIPISPHYNLTILENQIGIQGGLTPLILFDLLHIFSSLLCKRIKSWDPEMVTLS